MEPKSIKIGHDCSLEFLQGMANRMEVSFHKYGAVWDAYPEKLSALESLKQRIHKYLETGNTEFLIDAANFCMIEFMCPSVRGAAFTPTDSGESPGRMTTSGRLTGDVNHEVTKHGGKASKLSQFR